MEHFLAFFGSALGVIIAFFTVIDKLTSTHKQKIQRLEDDVKELEKESKELKTLIAQQSNQISVLNSIMTRVEKSVEKINDKLE